MHVHHSAIISSYGCILNVYNSRRFILTIAFSLFFLTYHARYSLLWTNTKKFIFVSSLVQCFYSFDIIHVEIIHKINHKKCEPVIPQIN